MQSFDALPATLLQLDFWFLIFDLLACYKVQAVHSGGSGGNDDSGVM